MTKMYRVYSIIERPKQEDFWLNIGMAFPHEKGDGFNVVLQALPLHGNGKLVMRAFDPEAPVAQDGEKRADERGEEIGSTKCPVLQATPQSPIDVGIQSGRTDEHQRITGHSVVARDQAWGNVRSGMPREVAGDHHALDVNGVFRFARDLICAETDR